MQWRRREFGARVLLPLVGLHSKDRTQSPGPGIPRLFPEEPSSIMSAESHDFGENLATAWYLKRVQLLRELSDPQIAELRQIGDERLLQRREQVVLPGDPGDAVFFFLEGRVRMSRFDAEGREVAAAVLEAGELLAVEALDAMAPRSFLAEALDAVRLVRVTRDALHAFLAEHEEVARVLHGAAAVQEERCPLPSWIWGEETA